MAKRKMSTVSIPVSRTNVNRVRFGTHTLDKVLKLEGHQTINGHLLMDEREISFNRINLVPKKKRTVVIRVAANAS